MTIAASFTPKPAILSFAITHELLTMRLFLDSLANNNFRMKKLILTLLVTCSFAVLNAQTENNDNKQHRRGGNPAEMVEKRTQDMVKKYALSAEQAEKMKALNEKYMKRGKPQRDMKGGDKPQCPQKDGNVGKGNGNGNGKRGPRGMRPNMEEYNKELKLIMNDDQYKAYTADMEKKRAERKKARDNKEEEKK